MEKVIGKVVGLEESKKRAANPFGVIQVKAGRKLLDLYAFDFNYSGFRKLKKGDILLAEYKVVNSKGQTFNRISWMAANPITNEIKSNKEIKENSDKHKIITGTLTNCNNTRGVKLRKKDEVSFCIKEKNSKKVSHCYCNKVLTESSFFLKGMELNLEIIHETRGDQMVTKVFSFFKR
jgi:hypothetical protein